MNANASVCFIALCGIFLQFDEGFIRCKRIVFCMRDLQFGTRGQSRPPLVSTYGEAAAFAAN